MRFVTFTELAGGPQRPGVLRDGNAEIVDLSASYTSMLNVIDAGDAGLETAQRELATPTRVVQLEQASLLAPLPEPRQMRDCMVYEKHLRQATEQGQKLMGIENPSVTLPPIWYKQPVYYKGNRFSVIGPDQDIQWPSYSDLLDFELELAVVIATKCRDLTPANALDNVFGYMIFNDVSARDAQMAEMGGTLGPAKGKDFDTGNVLGPWLVTRDEAGDIAKLKVRASVNGEIVADTTSSDMQHDLGTVLSHISASETLYPGEVIGLGTIGDCCLLEHGRFLNPGDVIEFQVEKLGTLRNRIIKAQ